MATHLGTLFIFSVLVSLVFAFLQRDDPQARWRFGLKAFALFMLSTLLLGWVMAQFAR
jgi:hypothetical protein